MAIANDAQPTEPDRSRATLAARCGVAAISLAAALLVFALRGTVLDDYTGPLPSERIARIYYSLIWALSIVDLRLEDEIQALADGRGRRILRGVLSGGAARRAAIELLGTWTELYHARMPTEEELTRITVLRRRGDFRRDPDDPKHGKIVSRWLYVHGP